MNSIRKYKLEGKSETSVEIPAESKIIYIAWQYGHVGIWAEVNSKNANVVRKFHIYRTLEEIPEYPGVHVRSVLTAAGQVAFHVYEL